MEVAPAAAGSTVHGNQCALMMFYLWLKKYIFSVSITICVMNICAAAQVIKTGGILGKINNTKYS